jgi:hypothetical protein
MFNFFLSLFVSVEVSNAYANVLSIIVFFSNVTDSLYIDSGIVKWQGYVIDSLWSDYRLPL